METRVTSGIEEFDGLLFGGFVRGNSYLIRGGPGSGKTTLGMQFCSAARAAKQRALYITMGESEARLRADATSLSINLDGVQFLDLTPSPQSFMENQHYDIFSPSEVENEPTTRKIIDAIDSFKPQRIFVDAITHFRYITNDAFQYRKEVMAPLSFLTSEHATVLFSSEATTEIRDDDLQFIADGVIELTNDGLVRSLRITKMRGSEFRPGDHGLRLRGRGLELFPALDPSQVGQPYDPLPLGTGIPSLDALLHGGLERGSSTFVFGPGGTGKTTLTTMLALSGVARQEHCAYFSFEENYDLFARHMQQLGVDLSTPEKKQYFHFFKIQPNDLTAEEFAHTIKNEINTKDCRNIVIDSLAGYHASLRGRELGGHLHTLCKYLSNFGCNLIMVGERGDIVGNTEDHRSVSSMSYIADNVIELRDSGPSGHAGTGIRVVKKRLSSFNRLTYEFNIKPGLPIQVGVAWPASNQILAPAHDPLAIAVPR